MKDKITELLTTTLNYIYCHNCDSSDLPEDNEDYGCGDCHRKSMGWALSKSSAEEIADKILKEISEDPYTVDATHTDPTEKETALALAERRLKKAEAALKEACGFLEYYFEGYEAKSRVAKWVHLKCEKFMKSFRDKQLESTLMPDKGESK